MMWFEWIANQVAPRFGGVATFVLDPDNLLEEPLVREALAAQGVQVESWHGRREELENWRALNEEDRPVIRVAPNAPSHLINETLQNAVLLDVSVAKLFSKIDPEVALAVDRDLWPLLFKLNEIERPMRTRLESATAVARAVYGVDPLLCKLQGWDEGIKRVAETGLELPRIIVEEIVPKTEAAAAQALCDASVARQRSHRWGSLSSAPGASAPPGASSFSNEELEALLNAFRSENTSAAEILAMGLRYGGACARGLPLEIKAQCNEGFLTWLRKNYSLALMSHHPKVLSLHTLIARQFEAGQKFMLVVVDAMGVEAYATVRHIWSDGLGLIPTAEHAAFAMIPTVTQISRRAIFEGVLPPQFSLAAHTPSLERKLWEARTGTGAYFSSQELNGIRDALFQGKPVAIVDVSWDKRGHAVDPTAESIGDVASLWAKHSSLPGIIQQAVDNGYKVVLTSDHGQAIGYGIGIPNLGNAIDERSKRFLGLVGDAVLSTAASHGIHDFHPITCPKSLPALFARHSESFDLAGVACLSHGGLAIEEVIVPVVEYRNE